MLKHIITYLFLLLCATAIAQQGGDTVCINMIGRHYYVDKHIGSTYLWSVTGGSIVKGGNSEQVIVDWGNQVGQYSISVTETSSKGCAAVTSIPVFVTLGGFVPGITAPKYACYNSTITASGSKALRYLWSTGDTTQSIDIMVTSDTTLSLKQWGDCGSYTSYVSISVSRPIADFIINPSTTFTGKDVHLQYSGSNDVTDFVWLIENANKTISNDKDPIVQFMKVGKPRIKLVVKNSLGCTDSLVKDILVSLDAGVLIPNAFSPNGDGQYDILKIIVPESISSYRFTVFNRWGNMVFTTTTVEKSWGGEYGEMHKYFDNGTDADGKVPSGSYVYIFEGIKNGEKVSQTGLINVVE